MLSLALIDFRQIVSFELYVGVVNNGHTTDVLKEPKTNQHCT